jgi:tagaturonate reductase
MNLSLKNIVRNKIKSGNKLSIPDSAVCAYPEKVLQFGTGILLRALPDYFIDHANKQGIFKGRIVVVKSTSGSADDFEAQDCLYTLATRGLENGECIEKYDVNASISRVLSARSQWAEIMNTASNPLIQVVISNTTEVGIQYVEESISLNPPESFPAKLTAWLYERFKKLGDDSPTTVVIPTELISENGKQLFKIVLQLIIFNRLEPAFLSWIYQKVIFCNSLVDRIVTGLPSQEEQERISQELGYTDALLTITEPYRLWAIEAPDSVKPILGFAQADPAMVVTPDITYYRERKLRILNGSHTIAIFKGILKGLDTVLQCMEDEEMGAFFKKVIHEEIIPSIPNANANELRQYGNEILDRFRNPFLEHKLINISLQATYKMRMRNIPTIVRYYQKYQVLPLRMMEGFASYLLFMRAEKEENGKFYGSLNGKYYPIQDESASYFAALWQQTDLSDRASVEKFVQTIGQDTELWGKDLSSMNGFTQMLSELMMDAPVMITE